MANKRTILIVDDHALFREGLKAIISRNPAYEVVGETGRGDSAIQMAQSLRPDLVLVDISLPDQSGIEVALQVRRSLPKNAFTAGATGFVTKNSAPERLLQAMDVVLTGEYFLDSAVSQKVVQRLAGIKTNPASMTDSGYEALTPREQEIFGLLAEGHSMKHIGERLFISPKTVENHRTSIMRKLDVHSSLELIRYAAKVGIIDVDRWKD
jgi:DNA-binding NarL/FixJ family response regulator